MAMNIQDYQKQIFLEGLRSPIQNHKTCQTKIPPILWGALVPYLLFLCWPPRAVSVWSKTPHGSRRGKRSQSRPEEGRHAPHTRHKWGKGMSYALHFLEAILVADRKRSKKSYIDKTTQVWDSILASCCTWNAMQESARNWNAILGPWNALRTSRLYKRDDVFHKMPAKRPTQTPLKQVQQTSVPCLPWPLLQPICELVPLLVVLSTVGFPGFYMPAIETTCLLLKRKNRP